jgi:hypothetical protein
MAKLILNKANGWVLMDLLMGQSIVIILLLTSLPLCFSVQKSLLSLESRISVLNTGKHLINSILSKQTISHDWISITPYDQNLNKISLIFDKKVYLDVLYEK